MPTEQRRILFSTRETVDALRMYCKSAGQDFPEGDSFDIALAPSEDNGLRVQVQNTAGESLRTFTAAELVVAFMQMCNNMAIPIPRRAKKSVVQIKNQPALLLTLGV